MVRTELAKHTEYAVPIVRLGEGEDALVLDFWVDEAGDVQASVVLDVDEPFWMESVSGTKEDDL